MRISDWSSDVCSSDLLVIFRASLSDARGCVQRKQISKRTETRDRALRGLPDKAFMSEAFACVRIGQMHFDNGHIDRFDCVVQRHRGVGIAARIEDHGLRAPRIGFVKPVDQMARSEEHTSELQSLMRISYAVFCLKKKKKKRTH